MAVDGRWGIRTGIGTAVYVTTVAVLALFAHDLLGLSLTGFLGFLVYLVFYVHLPGRTLFHLLGIRSVSGLAADALSFFLGFFFLTVQYFLFTWVGARVLLAFVSPALLVAWVGVALRRGLGGKGLWRAVAPAADGPAYVLASVGMAVSAFFTLFRYPPPDVVAGVRLYPDIAWHIGNVGILSGPNGFQDTRVDGVTFTYHYFSDLFFAIERLVFGASPFDLVVQYPFVVIGTVLGFTAAAFFTAMMPERKALAPLAATALLFVPAVDSSFGNYLFFHFFTNINAMAFALPVLMVLLLLVKAILDDPRDTRAAWLLAPLVFLLAGLKGPLAIAFVASLLAFAVLLALRRGLPGIWAIALPSACAAYAVVHFTLLDNGLQLLDFGLSSPNGILSRIPAYAGLLSAFPRSPLHVLLLILPNFLVVATPFAVFFLFRAARTAADMFRRKAVPDFTLFLLAFSVLSLGAFYLIGHSGLSQMYFLFGAAPSVLLLGFEEAGRLLSPARPRSTRGLVALLLAVTFTFGTVSTVSGLLSNAGSTLSVHAVDLSSPTVNKISAAEYDGLRWLQSNTPPTALFATNRHGRDRKFFLYSAYSGRRFYIEGSAYAANSGLSPERALEQELRNDMLFRDVTTDRHGLAKRLGIGYLVLFKHEYLKSPPEAGSGFVRVYDNKDLSVYRVE